jgi:hypothetical protein
MSVFSVPDCTIDVKKGCQANPGQKMRQSDLPTVSIVALAASERPASCLLATDCQMFDESQVQC